MPVGLGRFRPCAHRSSYPACRSSATSPAGSRWQSVDGCCRRGSAWCAPCLWVFGLNGSKCRGTGAKTDPSSCRTGSPSPRHLWLTAQVLQQGADRLARRCVFGQSVFGDLGDIPEALLASSGRRRSGTGGPVAKGQQNTIKLSSGYTADGTEWWERRPCPVAFGRPVNVISRWVDDTPGTVESPCRTPSCLGLQQSAHGGTADLRSLGETDPDRGRSC